MRRIGILLLAATVGFVGLAPSSLCATMANLPADCVPTPHCESMGGEQPDAVVASEQGDCCQVSSAPIPQGKVEVAAPAVAIARTSKNAAAAPSTRTVASVFTPRTRSAPFDFQSSLCVFLI